jgi:hypothetical protein
MSTYTQYLDWYDKMPETLRLGRNSTPAVLFAHMSYHFAIIHLFRPFLNLQVSRYVVSPRDITHQAADAIQGLLRSFSQLYTLRRAPSFVPYLTLASAISHLDIDAVTIQDNLSDTYRDMSTVTQTRHHVSKELSRDVYDLRDMTISHRSAQQVLDLIGYLSKERGIDVGFDGNGVSVDDCDRLARPYTKSVALVARRLRGEDFMGNA